MPWYRSPQRLLLANLLVVLVGGVLGAAVLLQQPQHAHLKATLMGHVEHVHTKAAAHMHTFTTHVGQHWATVHSHIAPYTDGVRTHVVHAWEHVITTTGPYTQDTISNAQRWWGLVVETMQMVYREVQYWVEHAVQWGTVQWQRGVAYFTTVGC